MLKQNMDENDKLDLTSTVLLLSKSHPSGPQMNTNIPKNIEKKIDTPNRILPPPTQLSLQNARASLIPQICTAKA